MNQVPMNNVKAYNANNITSINSVCVNKPLGFHNIITVNLMKTAKQLHSDNQEPLVNSTFTVDTLSSQSTVRSIKPPHLLIPTQKGQKIVLGSSADFSSLDVLLGWNVLNSACDIDVSAFLLDSTGKVLSDEWFVFYGQTSSPDNTVKINPSGSDSFCESVEINTSSMNPNINKVVFVLTINEALQKKLNFSMVKDAYIQINNGKTGKEIASFELTDYYPNVTSMMIGEIYLYNGIWKFNALGNGVARDLAGLCELYGVQTN